jgi:hypothetical protein
MDPPLVLGGLADQYDFLPECKEIVLPSIRRARDVPLPVLVSNLTQDSCVAYPKRREYEGPGNDRKTRSRAEEGGLVLREAYA